MTTCDFCSAQACICATGATPVKHQTESAPLSKQSTFERRMVEKKMYKRGNKQRKDKSASDVPPSEEKQQKVRKEWTADTVTVHGGLKKKQF